MELKWIWIKSLVLHSYQKVQKIVQKFKSSSLSTSLILENDTNVKTVKSVFEKKILFNSLFVQIYRE
mgnify:FL=1